MSTIDNTQSDSNASNQTDAQTETKAWTDLTAFQQEALQAIAVIEDDPEREESGSKVLDELELRYQGDITTARLYPNLDELVDAGLVEKGQLDRRANSYTLTAAGEAMLEEEARNLAQVAGIPVPMTDGGQYVVEKPEFDGAMLVADLTAFQTRTLFVTAQLTDADVDCYGLAIKRRLEDFYGDEVNHGRLYPNLDQLVEEGFVEKSMLDRRTNTYEVTDEGREALREYLDWQAEMLGTGGA